MGPMISQEMNYDLHYGEIREMFYRRHTALTLAAV